MISQKVQFVAALLSFMLCLSQILADCDHAAAEKCETQFYYCKLYGGPAQDSENFCRCAASHYGSCIDSAGPF